jgi:hypothetical protein
MDSGQKSPCFGCRRERKDKNVKVCFECKKRLAYCISLNHSVDQDPGWHPTIYLNLPDVRDLALAVNGG